jgi:hypothetical protein
MRGLFNPEIPPERSNCWMTCLTCYTATVGTELFSYIESLWETAEKDCKLQNDHTRKIRELERKVLTQGRALEYQDDLLHKMTATLKKQEKVMEMLTQKIMLLESHDDDNGERLKNHSYRLGCLELPQVVRESGSNLLVFDLIVPHFRLLVFRLLWSMGLLRLRRGGLPFLLRRLAPPPVWVIPGVVWRGRTPVPAVSAQVGVVVREVLIVAIMIVVLVDVLVGSTVGLPVL